MNTTIETTATTATRPARTMTGITDNDKGYIANADVFGKSQWGYTNLESNISLEHVESIANYPVELKPVMFEHNGQMFTTGQNAIFRPDTGDMLYNNVGNKYHIMSNQHLVDQAKTIMDNYSNFSIDSCGTLKGGQTFFVSMIVHEMKIVGDMDSRNFVKLFMCNAFGGDPIVTGLSNYRMECGNTKAIALKEAKKNGSLSRIRHTLNAQSKLSDRVFDLTDLIGHAVSEEEKLNKLAVSNVNATQVNGFLEQLFPTDKEGRSKATNERKQDEILEIFETKSDLSHLADTRYKLLQSVTDYTSNKMVIRNNKDNNLGVRFESSISENGTANKLNQLAYSILLNNNLVLA
jgi:hypothetical protein